MNHNESYKEFAKETEDLSLEQRTIAFEKFNEAYDVHKAVHGSYGALQGDNYVIKMKERHDYKMEAVRKYICGLN